MMRTFTIPGPPVGKQRARTVRNNGITRSFTPEKTVNFEALVKTSFRAENPEAVPAPGPVGMLCTIIYPIPQSWSGRKKAAALAEIIRPTVKPDGSNVIKAVEDALNGIAWVDDRQIVDERIIKLYGIQPRTEVTIWEMEADA